MTATRPDGTHRHRRAPGGDPSGLRSRRLALGIGLLATLLLIRILAPDDGGLDLPNLAQDFVTLSLSVVVESLPFVFLGIVISIGVQLWVPPKVFARVLPRTPWLRRMALSLLGVFLPVCECGNVPLARGLVSRGFTVPEAMTFLFAAPILNPVTIITTYHAFGFDDGILVARILGGFLIANLLGWLYSRHPAPERLLTPSFAASCALDHARHGHGRPSVDARIRESLELFRRETSAMLPALFVGSGVAGAIQVAVSRDTLVALGSNPLLSVLALMALAFVVSICASVDAFFVLALGSTFMPGAIVAFLVFGPMIDIKMLALLRTTFTGRTLTVLTVLIGLASLVLGLVVNSVS